MSPRPQPTAQSAKRLDLLYWLVLFAVLWLLLSGGSGWLLGSLSVLGAAGLTVWLGLKPIRIRLKFLPVFVFFFAKALISGGWDVAKRAFQPTMPLSPAWLEYPLTAQSPRVRLVFSAMVGLLPGTFSSGYEGDVMTVHVLDQRHPWEDTARLLELHLMRLLGESDG